MASRSSQIFDMLCTEAIERALTDLKACKPENEPELTPEEEEGARFMISFGVLRGIEATRHFLRHGTIPEDGEWIRQPGSTDFEAVKEEGK